jgi:hypothetical protein
LTSACGKPAEPVIVVVEKPAAPAFDPATAFPRADVRRPAVSRKPEPRAVAARAAVIRRDAEAIEAECRQAAGGDWERWQRDTAAYRAALKGKIDALKVFDPPRAVYVDVNSEPLEGRDNFPLFEVGPHVLLRHLHQPEVLDAFRKDRPVVAIHRWLSARGIDLMFVPVPKMFEVYVEHFIDPCPPDGIIAPHVRRALHELLAEDVEVVDGFPLYRALRDSDPEYLYNTADPHWGPRGMRVMAKEIADRIARYQFGASARYGLPVVRSTPDRFTINGRNTDAEHADAASDQAGWPTLSEQQQARARAVQSSCIGHVTTLDGKELPDDLKSPVLVVGNSFVQHFREQLARELNLFVHSHWRHGSTTEMMTDFLSEPDLIANCKVIVWVVSDWHLQKFKPLPKEFSGDLRAHDPPGTTK